MPLIELPIEFPPLTEPLALGFFILCLDDMAQLFDVELVPMPSVIVLVESEELGAIVPGDILPAPAPPGAMAPDPIEPGAPVPAPAEPAAAPLWAKALPAVPSITIAAMAAKMSSDFIVADLSIEDHGVFRFVHRR